MATIRFKALQELFSRQAQKVVYPSLKASDYFGINVFDMSKMKKYLSKEAFKSVEKAMKEGTGIDRKVADQVAVSMKEWAISRGATHYSRKTRCFF